ncbi:MAG: tRNA pseudouridine55 synthase, partial [bacterium]
MTEKIGTHAIFNIYKPEGITSYGAIREIKKLTGQKKVGHLGTLDPLAEGILPIFLGKMTKLIPLFNQGDKTYQTTVYLGTTSTTLDREGEKTEVPIPESCTEETILQVLKTFEGEIEQIPPMLSAIKKDGKPLYKLARAGKEVERDPRKIQIYWIRNIQINLPEITFDVHCSKGTYIRVLAEEIGKALGTGSYLSKLIRTQCNGLFTIENSFTLDQLKKIDNFVAEDFSISPTSLLLDFHQIG